MAILRKSELNQMNKESLENRLNELRRELMRLNAQISTGTPPENPGKIRIIKRTVARILTQLNKKDKTKTEEEVKSKG